MIVRRSVETPKFSFILKYTTIQNVSVITYVPKGGVSINRNIPNWYVLIYSQLLGGSASFPGNAATKSAFSRARSVYCSVSGSQWRRFVGQSTGKSWRVKINLHVRESVSHCKGYPSQTC